MQVFCKTSEKRRIFSICFRLLGDFFRRADRPGLRRIHGHFVACRQSGGDVFLSHGGPAVLVENGNSFFHRFPAQIDIRHLNSRKDLIGLPNVIRKSDHSRNQKEKDQIHGKDNFP